MNDKLGAGSSELDNKGSNTKRREIPVQPLTVGIGELTYV